MKSLFLRLLVSMWLTMAVLVGVFALIHAWAMPRELSEGRRRFVGRSVELRAEHALACVRDGGADCARTLRPLDERDDRVAVYRGAELVLGDPVDGAEALVVDARGAADGAAFRSDESDRSAVILRNDPTLAAVAIGPARLPWVFFVGPDTLPYRLGAIVAVTGLVAFALARWLSRPLRTIRGATQRMAAGDLTVRVSPELAGADGETLALGHDLDAMAERIHDLLEAHRRLLRDVSHELRSPLARLAISLELVRRKSSDEVAPALDRIERETERLNTMIGELLTLSRLESGQGLETTEPVVLGELVDGVIDDVALEAESRGVKLRADVAACDVKGTAELLRRAVENVVRNAIRYSEPGTDVDVTLACSGDEAVIRVRDHGPGVPDAALARIFEPFYRVETDRARSQGGTGIGLAITHRALALHGGSATAKNADGGGLQVTLRLPLRA